MFIEREKHGGDATFIVHCFTRFNQHDCDEFLSLASTSEANVAEVFQHHIRKENPVTFITSGILEQIADRIKALASEGIEIDLVLINAILRPSQERNIELALGCRIVDRAGLILDVFAKQASSEIGKLQVELAQLQFLSTRLKRAWTHLERQKGGIGLRGPGESQLATDKHLLRTRIAFLRRRLSVMQTQRKQNNKLSKKNLIPKVTLVGYTNAGKSSLHNALASSGAIGKDRLFSTLSSMSRSIKEQGMDIILTDTVGFIQQLPHQLVESFHSTLEEISDADLLLHVIDYSSETIDQQIQTVNDVLKQIGASDIPQLLVYNKVDIATNNPNKDSENIIYVSAKENKNIDVLHRVIADTINKKNINSQWCFTDWSAEQNKLRHDLYECSLSIKEKDHETYTNVLECSLSVVDFERLSAKAKVNCSAVKSSILQNKTS